MLAKSKLNTTEVVLSKALIDPNISHDEFALINNLLKEYNDMKEEIKNYNDKQRTLWFINKFEVYIKQCYWIAWSVEKIEK